MKKIETKIAKNGTKMYYVEGKRVNREVAIQTAADNRGGAFIINREKNTRVYSVVSYVESGEYTSIDTYEFNKIYFKTTYNGTELWVNPDAEKFGAMVFESYNKELVKDVATAIETAFINGEKGVTVKANSTVEVINAEANPDDYAVSQEALEVATNAEIEAMKVAREERIKAAQKEVADYIAKIDEQEKQEKVAAFERELAEYYAERELANNEHAQPCDDNDEAFNLIPNVSELNDVEVDLYENKRQELIARNKTFRGWNEVIYSPEFKVGISKMKVKNQNPTAIGTYLLDYGINIDNAADGCRFLFTAHGLPLGRYDTPSQVNKVIDMLKEAIARGDKEFQFPKAKDLGYATVFAPLTNDEPPKPVELVAPTVMSALETINEMFPLDGFVEDVSKPNFKSAVNGDWRLNIFIDKNGTPEAVSLAEDDQLFLTVKIKARSLRDSINRAIKTCVKNRIAYRKNHNAEMEKYEYELMHLLQAARRELEVA